MSWTTIKNDRSTGRMQPAFSANLLAAELCNVSKSFGDCKANQGVDLKVRAGTIHALIGENGAGKSTAMKMLFGMVHPDSGTIRFSDKEVQNWNPQKASALGIGMVHQHFMLAGNETVHDNLVLGVETSILGFRNAKEEKKRLESLMDSTGLRVPLEKTIEGLPVGLQSRCEILKVLYRNANFLILDEPTAVLSPQEIQDFLNTLRVLRSQGHTILLVTHKLNEVMAIADDATILRAGKTVADRKIADTNVEELSFLMVGRRLQMPKVAPLATINKSAPEKIALTIKTSEYALDLHPGEITGIAGVEGNGQEDLINAITAMDMRMKPIAFIPGDRHKEGLVLCFSLTENLRLGKIQATKKPFDYFGPATQSEKEILKNYDVRPSDPTLSAQSLSGGNQQKLIIARELSGISNATEADSKVIIAVHPTRGVDLGAIESIHQKLLEAASAGAAVLIVSSELDELMSLSHRIGVLYRNKICEWFSAHPKYDEKLIGLAMLRGKS